MNEEEIRKQRKALEKKWYPAFTVPEATAMPVMRLGALKEIYASYKDHNLDTNVDSKFNVINTPGAGAGQGPLGGLHPKVPGLDTLYPYNFRWKDRQLEVKGRYVAVVHEKVINYIFLKPDYYGLDVEKAETKAAGRGKKERIPVTIRANVVLRVVNPYKALFKAPSNWFENTSTRLEGMIRDWVTTKTVDEVLTFRGKKEEVWNEFKDRLIIKSLEDDWGIRVEENGIDFVEIIFEPEYQKALAAQKVAELEANAKKRRLEIEAQARASETIGTVIQMLCQETEMKEKDIRTQIRDDPEGFVKKYKPILEKNWDLLNRKIAIEGKSFVDIRVEGAKGIERAFLNILTAWQRMPRGKEEKSSDKGEHARERAGDETKKEKRKRILTDEEFDKGSRKAFEEANKKK